MLNSKLLYWKTKTLVSYADGGALWEFGLVTQTFLCNKHSWWEGGGVLHVLRNLSLKQYVLSHEVIRCGLWDGNSLKSAIHLH